MKEGIVVGCLLKVVAMASDDEGFTLSVTSKLREFTALGYPSHVLNGAIGRAFARTRDERLLRARLCSQRWEANLYGSPKRKNLFSKPVRAPSKGGCCRLRDNLVCRQPNL